MSFLELDTSSSIAQLRMNRPDIANAVYPEAHTELVGALREIAGRTDLRALVISGAGRHFSAGGDLDSIVEAHHSLELRRHMVHEATEMFGILTRLDIPVISAVQGTAAGLGATIAVASDIIVADKNARFIDPHVVLGLVAGDGGVIAWTQAMGINRAKRYLLTGDPLSAESAYDMGVVTDLVDTPEEVLPHALSIAQRIVSYPPLGVQGTKRTFNKITQQIAHGTLELGLMLEAESFQAPELLETVRGLQAAKAAAAAAKAKAAGK